MSKGVVKFFDSKKEFGFIKPESGGEDVFVHATGCIDAIADGDSVEYEIKETKRGVKAVKVKKFR